MFERFNVLERARVALERGVKKHGEPESSLERIATLWNAYKQNRREPNADLTAADVADMLILLKMARNQTKANPDNYTDIAGYAALGCEAKDNALAANQNAAPADQTG